MSIVNTPYFNLAAINALAASGACLSGKQYHLFQNQLQPTPDTPLSSFTEATFQGYAAVSPVVWGTGFLDQSENGNIVGAVIQSQCTGTGNIPQTIYGYYVTGTGSGGREWPAVLQSGVRECATHRGDQ